MPADELIQEAARQMTICNACRYCEGYCAVFPAMERRRAFAKGDILYLANLCFDCRACYYACQYAPPHPFDVNVPRIFAQVRTDTYQEYSWPGLLARLVRRGAAATAAVVVAAVGLVVALVLLLRGPAVVLAPQLGAEAFFRVVPYAAMTVPFLLMALYGAVLFAAGAVRFWRDTGGSLAATVSAAAFGRALGDALGLRYLRGGGDGCNYPDARFSQARRWLHHLTFYGFLLDLAATTVAALYHNVFHWPAPYPLLSLPVVLGTVGGVLLLVGTIGLLALKWRSDRDPAEARMLAMDVAFLVVLLLAAATGLLLLALRETAAMGLLLAVHLGVIAAFFLTAPYGKLAHAVYRYAALVRNRIESERFPDG